MLRKFSKNIFSKISTKIYLYYLLILSVSLLYSSFLYREVNEYIFSQEISKVNYQTLIYAKSNVERIVDTVNVCSKLIIAKKEMANILADGEQNLEQRKESKEYLSLLLETTEDISDIYLFDYNFNEYSVSKRISKKIEDDFRDSLVVRAANKKKGEYFLVFNGEGIFEKDNGENYVSFIRIVNDLNTQKRIGLLIINISVDRFVDDSRENSLEDEGVLIIQNELRKNIAYNGNVPDNINSLFDYENNSEEYFYKMIKYQDRLTLYSTLKLSNMGWTIVSMVPFNLMYEDYQIYIRITIIMMIVNAILLLLGGVLVTRLIALPLKKIVKSIGNNDKKLEPICLNTKIYEMNLIQNEYNRMIDKIQNLINEIIEDQKEKRKKDMMILQAQIKPHFLYNTLDTIRVMAKKGKNVDVECAVKALGEFYRTGLGKGSEFVAVENEIQMLKDYLILQNYRYKDIVNAKFYVEESIKNVKILKFILQPFIENALYHGIRPTGEAGNIYVSVKKDKANIVFKISDDGVGSERSIILGEKSKNNEIESGFGVLCTLKRIKLYYGENSKVEVETKRGIGTTIIISLRYDIDE